MQHIKKQLKMKTKIYSSATVKIINFFILGLLILIPVCIKAQTTSSTSVNYNLEVSGGTSAKVKIQGIVSLEVRFNDQDGIWGNLSPDGKLSYAEQFGCTSFIYNGKEWVNNRELLEYLQGGIKVQNFTSNIWLSGFVSGCGGIQQRKERGNRFQVGWACSRSKNEDLGIKKFEITGATVTGIKEAVEVIKSIEKREAEEKREREAQLAKEKQEEGSRNQQNNTDQGSTHTNSYNNQSTSETSSNSYQNSNQQRQINPSAKELNAAKEQQLLNQTNMMMADLLYVNPAAKKQAMDNFTGAAGHIVSGIAKDIERKQAFNQFKRNSMEEFMQINITKRLSALTNFEGENEALKGMLTSFNGNKNPVYANQFLDQSGESVMILGYLSKTGIEFEMIKQNGNAVKSAFTQKRWPTTKDFFKYDTEHNWVYSKGTSYRKEPVLWGDFVHRIVSAFKYDFVFSDDGNIYIVFLDIRYTQKGKIDGVDLCVYNFITKELLYKHKINSSFVFNALDFNAYQDASGNIIFNLLDRYKRHVYQLEKNDGKFKQVNKPKKEDRPVGFTHSVDSKSNPYYFRGKTELKNNPKTDFVFYDRFTSGFNKLYYSKNAKFEFVTEGYLMEISKGEPDRAFKFNLNGIPYSTNPLRISLNEKSAYYLTFNPLINKSGPLISLHTLDTKSGLSSKKDFFHTAITYQSNINPYLGLLNFSIIQENGKDYMFLSFLKDEQENSTFYYLIDITD
jgi:hypothetical protein